MSFLFDKPRKGFSLVELLITLAIMGILAAATIPPLFQSPSSSQPAKYNTMAKDTALMIVSAYEQYKATNTTVATTVSVMNLTPYMNYIKVDSTSIIDDYQTNGSRPCNNTGGFCLVLHNGAKLQIPATDSFGGTNTTNLTHAYFDPDGVYSGTTNGQGKSLELELYYDGALKTWGTARTNSCGSWSCTFNPWPSADPPWFTGF